MFCTFPIRSSGTCVSYNNARSPPSQYLSSHTPYSLFLYLYLAAALRKTQRPVPKHRRSVSECYHRVVSVGCWNEPVYTPSPMLFFEGYQASFQQAMQHISAVHEFRISEPAWKCKTLHRVAGESVPEHFHSSHPKPSLHPSLKATDGVELQTL
jgi:hypothetical protein